jgi:hypothetical protein
MASGKKGKSALGPVVIAVLTLMSSVLVSYFTARSTLQGGIDTEVLRLRSAIVTERWKGFSTLAARYGIALRTALFEDDPIRQGRQIVGFTPLYAELSYSALSVPAPQDWNTVDDSVVLLSEAQEGVLDAYRDMVRQRGDKRGTAVSQSLTKLNTALYRLQACVDWAAERRLERTRSGPISEHVPRWIAEVKAHREELKSAGR